MKHSYQRLLIRASLIYMALGMVIGLYMYAAPLLSLPMDFGRLRSLHVHMILLGGVVQLIMGVALWMFPRRKTPPRYTPANQGMLLFGMLNFGNIARFLFEFLDYGRTGRWIAFCGALLQVFSIVFFLYLIYGRIRRP